jgi:L-fuculose-phosphate aldolase
MLERERERVAAAGRRLAHSDLVVGSAGNASLRAGDLIAITSAGSVLADLTPDDIVVVDSSGGQVVGSTAPSSELGLHLGIYERFEARGIAHTHAPISTALACVIDELPVVHYHMVLLGGSVRVAPYARYGTAELASATLAALEERSAALMANHGAVTFADDVESAVDKALLLEWACSVYWHAAAIGQPRVLDVSQVAAVGELRPAARDR